MVLRKNLDKWSTSCKPDRSQTSIILSTTVLQKHMSLKKNVVNSRKYMVCTNIYVILMVELITIVDGILYLSKTSRFFFSLQRVQICRSFTSSGLNLGRLGISTVSLIYSIIFITRILSFTSYLQSIILIRERGCARMVGVS